MPQRNFVVTALVFLASTASADWLSLPSTYTHSPVTGQPVDQYQPIAEPTGAYTPISSGGFHHVRSTLNYGKSADNYFRVDRWGEPVQPFAAFRFPFRPYGTPYPNWGPPYGGLGTDIQIGGGLGFPHAAPFASGFRFPPGRGVGQGFGFGSGRGFGPGRGLGFEQPISPLVPYPSVPSNPDRVSPIYDGHYPTYRD